LSRSEYKALHLEGAFFYGIFLLIIQVLVCIWLILIIDISVLISKRFNEEYKFVLLERESIFTSLSYELKFECEEDFVD
jgi:hypothetical protein